MPLELITGPANAGVTERVRTKLVARARSGDRTLLLVPSGPDVSRVTRELAAEIALGIGVRAFDNHLDALWEAFGDGRAIVTGVQRLVVLEESVNACAPALVAAPGRTTSAVRMLARIVQRAAESPHGISSEGVEGVAADLLHCVSVYESTLRRAGFIERGEAHRLASRLFGEVDLPALIAINGFSGLTRAQEQCVVNAAARTDVLVGLTYDPGVPATASAGPLADRLSQAGTACVLQPRSDDGVPGELTRIERSFGLPGAPDVRADGAVVLSEAWGEAAEAGRITREVQDSLREGVSPGRVAIVFRDPAAHARALRSMLDEAGIPAEYDMSVPLLSTGLGRALLMLLELGEPCASYEQLLDVLRSPFGPASDAVLDELDAHARRTRSRDPQAAEAWLRRHSPEDATFISEARRAHRDAGTGSSERRWYRLVAGMMRRAHGSEASTDPDLVMDAAAARVFIDAVRSVNALGPSGGAARALAAALREAQVALATSDRPDHVQVVSAERARGRRYDCVILGGLTAGEFPRLTHEDALSAPGIARAFERAGIDMSPRSDLEAERLLFYLAATRASERLVLSWQSHSCDGQPLRRSVFVDELLDLYMDPVSGEWYADAPPLRTLGLDGSSLHPAGPETERRTLRARASKNARKGGDEATIAEARRRAVRGKDPASDAVRRATAERRVFSPSEIEAYLQCPFRWYVGRIVAPRELDERFDAASAGLLAHDVLRRFYDAFTERSGLGRVTPDSLALARTVHEEVANAVLEQAVAIGASEMAAARAAALGTLRVVEADATLLPGFEPVCREWTFGFGDGDEPEPFAGFSLKGRIDRIDASAHALVVSDYKLGRVESERGVAKFESEGLVQLPLYAAVASRRLGRAVAGGLYRSVRGGKPRGFIDETLCDGGFVRTDAIPGPETEEVLQSAIHRAAEAVARMREGDIHAEPRSGFCPVYCPARSFCTGWKERRGGPRS